MILTRVGRSHRKGLHSGRNAARLSYFARGSYRYYFSPISSTPFRHFPFHVQTVSEFESMRVVTSPSRTMICRLARLCHGICSAKPWIRPARGRSGRSQPPRLLKQRLCPASPHSDVHGLNERVWTPPLMQAVFGRLGACGQVLSCVRPLYAADDTPRARMEMRGLGPNRLRELESSPFECWFSQPGLVDLCPYLSSDLPTSPTASRTSPFSQAVTGAR